MKSVTVNIVKAFTDAHNRPSSPRRKFTFRPKVRNGPRPGGGGRRRRRYPKPKR